MSDVIIVFQDIVTAAVEELDGNEVHMGKRGKKHGEQMI